MAPPPEGREGGVGGEDRPGGRGRARGGERPMGTAPYGGKGFNGRAVVSRQRPVGAASCRQQHSQVSCQTPPQWVALCQTPPPPHPPQPHLSLIQHQSPPSPHLHAPPSATASNLFTASSVTTDMQTGPTVTTTSPTPTATCTAAPDHPTAALRPTWTTTTTTTRMTLSCPSATRAAATMSPSTLRPTSHITRPPAPPQSPSTPSAHRPSSTPGGALTAARASQGRRVAGSSPRAVSGSSPNSGAVAGGPSPRPDTFRAGRIGGRRPRRRRPREGASEGAGHHTVPPSPLPHTSCLLDLQSRRGLHRAPPLGRPVSLKIGTQIQIQIPRIPPNNATRALPCPPPGRGPQVVL